MKLLVHFAVGVAGGVILAAASSSSVRRDFLLIFSSGFWAILPDGQWMLVIFELGRLTQTWGAVHDSVIANIFWFHHFLDQHEPTARIVTLYIKGTSLAVLFAAVVGYYKFRNWPRVEE